MYISLHTLKNGYAGDTSRVSSPFPGLKSPLQRTRRHSTPLPPPPSVLGLQPRAGLQSGRALLAHSRSETRQRRNAGVSTLLSRRCPKMSWPALCARSSPSWDLARPGGAGRVKATAAVSPGFGSILLPGA